jgi:hypothetical protein
VMTTIERNPQTLDALVRDLGRGLGAGAGALRPAAWTRATEPARGAGSA